MAEPDKPVVLRDENPASPTYGAEIVTTEETLEALERVLFWTLGGGHRA
jgi:hypothetical protein